MISLEMKALGFSSYFFFLFSSFISLKIDEVAATASVKKVRSSKKPLPVSSMFLLHVNHLNVMIEHARAVIETKGYNSCLT